MAEGYNTYSPKSNASSVTECEPYLYNIYISFRSFHMQSTPILGQRRFPLIYLLSTCCCAAYNAREYQGYNNIVQKMSCLECIKKHSAKIFITCLIISIIILVSIKCIKMLLNFKLNSFDIFKQGVSIWLITLPSSMISGILLLICALSGIFTNTFHLCQIYRELP